MGNLKSAVYTNRLNNLDELKQRIIIECADISPAVFKRVATSSENE